MNSSDFWKVKLAALLHDPPEKALVLMKDPAGHEGGTVAWIVDQLQLNPTPAETATIRRADRWASAADRPQFPRESQSGPYERWTQVDYAKEPVFIHPLSGRRHAIRQKLEDIPWEWIKDASSRHLSKLIRRDASGKIDHRLTFLAMWRLASLPPDETEYDLGELWSILPADTRVPDHSIWEHARLTSAFAGASASGGQPALILVSMGPVQTWIAQSRSTSDLWAGSHFLSRLSWEAMKMVCERFGPDALLLPNLHGTPLVDAWLEEVGVSIPDVSGWKHLKSDANPLFTAALPNRFIALIPAEGIDEFMAEMEQRIRDWVRRQVEGAAGLLLQKGGHSAELPADMASQIKKQLLGFPEFHWCAVRWPVGTEDDQFQAVVQKLAQSMELVYPTGSTGFFDHPSWRVVSGAVEVTGAKFYQPNPGTCYPAIYDLADRLMAAGKSLRAFEQVAHAGYRCSLCGEREWLTDDLELLAEPPGQRKTSIWSRVAEQAPSLAKRGEHLCALCTLKRFWPTLFRTEVEQMAAGVQRYTVSTHTMALAAGIERMLTADPQHPSWTQLADLIKVFGEDLWESALPRALVHKMLNHPHEDRIRRLPTLMDRIRESGDDKAMRKVESIVQTLSGSKPETYYALILMDGDRMGAWLSGTEESLGTVYRDSWHPQILSALAQKGLDQGPLAEYLNAQRLPSPGRHNAISTSLNHFALEVAPWILERQFKGKILYSGGDDLLALLSLDDLLPAMETLRCLYSGVEPEPAVCAKWLEGSDVRVKDGYVWMKGRLFRTMGEKATISAGVVIAHHTAPLAMVLRNLRQAERTAKRQGRDAFCVMLQKRSGGWTELASKWRVGNDGGGTPIVPVLMKTRDAFVTTVSRRAAYNLQVWFEGMAPDADVNMLQRLMAYQFYRQRKNKDDKQKEALTSLAQTVAELTVTASDRPDFLARLLTTCEFIAREGRQ